MKAVTRGAFGSGSNQWRKLSASLRWCDGPGRVVSGAYRKWMTGNMHTHSHTEVVLCLAGDHLYGLEGMARPLSPGEVLIIRPGVLHDATYSQHHGACTDMWLHFLTPGHVGINIVEHRPGLRLSSRRIVFTDAVINQDLQRACFLLSAQPNSPQVGQSGAFLFFLLQEILGSLAVNGPCEQNTDVNPVIPHIKEYIALNLSDRLTLSDLARVAGFSPFHFHREFRRVEKITPREFIEAERLKHACKLLEHGRSVTSAALDSGFSTCPQFNRVFKKRFGLAPVAWLKGKARGR